MKRAGLTLVEVLASLVIVSVLLTAVLAAKGRAMRQASAAHARLVCVDAVERLLSSWRDARTGAIVPPEASGGVLAGTGGCVWQLARRPDAVAEDLLSEVLVLQVANAETGTPALELELLVPQAEPAEPAEQVDGEGET